MGVNFVNTSGNSMENGSVGSSHLTGLDGAADVRALHRLTDTCPESARAFMAAAAAAASQQQRPAAQTGAVTGSGDPPRHHHNTVMQLDPEKRIRREIANSNERRRMQSINAGFQSLRNLLPRRDGDKMSKAAILQQTAGFIHDLLVQKARLCDHIEEYKRALLEHGVAAPDLPQANRHIAAPPKKRKRFTHVHSPADSSDDGVCTGDDAGSSKEHSSAQSTPPMRAVATSDSVETASSIISVKCDSPPPQHDDHQHQLEQLPQHGTAMTAIQSNAGLLMQNEPHQSSMPQNKMTDQLDSVHRQIMDLRLALEGERHLRAALEQQVRSQEMDRIHSLSRMVGMSSTTCSSSNASLLSDIALVVSASQQQQQQQQQRASTSASGDSLRHAIDALVSGSHVDGHQSFSSLGNNGGLTAEQLSALGLLQPAPMPSTAPISSAGLQHKAANDGKASLEVIVEAIRHLEGDHFAAERGALVGALPKVADPVHLMQHSGLGTR